MRSCRFSRSPTLIDCRGIWLVSILLCIILIQETGCFELRRIAPPIQQTLRQLTSSSSSSKRGGGISDSIVRIRICRNNKYGRYDDESLLGGSTSQCSHRLVVVYSKSSVEEPTNTVNNLRTTNRKDTNNGRKNKTTNEARGIGTPNTNTAPAGMYGSAPNVDAMVAHAGKLRQSIREQQIEHQRLEYQLICCTDNNSNYNNFTNNTKGIFNALLALSSIFRNNNNDNNDDDVSTSSTPNTANLWCGYGRR